MLALVGFAGVLAACSSDENAAPATTEGAETSVGVAATDPADTTLPSAVGPISYPDGLRGVRYCEVLMISLVNQQFQADVYNSLGFNDCPQDQWEALDADEINAANEAVVTILNGPRYWTLDRIDSAVREGAPVQTFGELTMFRAATIDLGNSMPSQTPYTERAITRETVFTWDAGTVVYQLVSPDGRVYTMQSYSLELKPDLTADTLAELGAQLGLPAGWSFNVVTLATQLDAISVDGKATVIQDEFKNTYQRIDSAP